MADLELTRAKGDRRLYALDGVGTLRVGGLLSRWAIARAVSSMSAGNTEAMIAVTSSRV